MKDSVSNKIVYGFHNRDKNKYSILKEGFPIIEEKEYQQFMITRDHIFTISETDINEILNSYETNSAIHSTLRKLANIIIIPGVITSLIYVLKIFGVLDYLILLDNFVPERLINTVFWFSALGVIMLWYATYKSIYIPKKLPQIKNIKELELDAVKRGDIKFGRYSQLNAKYFFSPELIEFLIFFKSSSYSVNKLLPSIAKDPFLKKVFARSELSNYQKLLINEELNVEKTIKITLEGARSIILYALEEALLTNSKYIEPAHLLFSVVKIFPVLSKGLLKENSSLNFLRKSYIYEQSTKEKLNRSFFDPEQEYFKTNGIARSWIFGYTYILNHFSKDLNEEVLSSYEKFGIGHQDEVEELASVIGKIGKKNALLIGDPGVGKSSLILGLAQRINAGDVAPQLLGKRIVQLDINGLIAHTANTKNLESTIQQAMEELKKAGNTILYIDEIQELIPAKAEESGHSLSGILLPYILDGHFPIVGTVNHANYKKYFYTNESLRQSFSNIEVDELSIEDTVLILQSKLDKLQSAYKIYITTSAVIACAELAQRYINERMLPDSAVDVLEESCTWAQNNKVEILTAEHIAKVVSLKSNIDVESIASTDVDELSKLEERIKARVVGEDEAISAIVDAIKRSKTGIRSPNKPIGVFLFLGPTGVGKTHLAKVLSEEFFKNKNDIVRLDMSEYKEEGSVTRFLGGKSGENTVSLVDKVKANPYTVVLFDEIEKANTQVLDLFLQIFDEGHITSTAGESISFKDTIIICTSNIGGEIILQSTEKKMLWEHTKDLVVMNLKQNIRPELYNRFDKVIVFSPQTIDTLANITALLLQELSERLSKQGFELKWNETIPMLIANKAYDPAFGARPIKRYLQENIEGKIANEIINNNIKSGDTVEIKESWII